MPRRPGKRSTPYRKRKGAQPIDVHGRLLCDRCGRPVDPWPLQRPDNCGMGIGICIRGFREVVASWHRYGFALDEGVAFLGVRLTRAGAGFSEVAGG